MHLHKTSFHFHPHFVLRTPLLPMQSLGISAEDFFKFSQQDFFKEAIYLASPVLHSELIKWHSNKLKDTKEINKLIISLYKYYTRMQTRCTPYGLFAGCSTGTWGHENNIILNEIPSRKTRLDMNYLCALAQQLNKNEIIAPLLTYFPNNSIYEFGNRLRYIEYKYINNKRVHQLTSVSNSEYLQKVLKHSEQGKSKEYLKKVLLEDPEISSDEAENFISELISNQILISELEPALTGEEFIYQIIKTLKKINTENIPYINSILEILENCQKQIGLIDLKKSNTIESYKEVFEKLSVLETPIEENYLFQTDLYKKTKSSELNISLQQDLKYVISFLNKLNPKVENQKLKKFKENFYAQYDQKEIPLLEALDPETGIGYSGKDVNGINVLLDDIILGSGSDAGFEVSWNKTQELLHNKLLDAAKNTSYTVVFTDDDIRNFTENEADLPDSIPVMFKIINTNKIFIQIIGGSSAANILGRFASGNNEILEIVKSVTKHEEEFNPDKVLAEIVHLPESRMGNILFRPVLRNHEIPFLGKSSLPAESQIELKDLMISIKKDKIFLRSKKINKEIIPRLSSAHNYSNNALPAYQFLCDMQGQYFEKTGLSFNWGNLAHNNKFLPRAEYKNVIIFRAQWQFLKEELQFFHQTDGKEFQNRLSEWLQKWQIPAQIIIAEGDNELFVDFNDLLSIQVLVNEIKKSEKIVFKEFLFANEELLVKDSSNSCYTNEFIAILLKDSPQAIPTVRVEMLDNFTLPTQSTLQRNFILGSEWLYYKFYCGIKTSDQLLVDVLKPLTDSLMHRDWISEFFFIRYADPEVHIRFRIKIKKSEHLTSVITQLNEYIHPLLDQGLILKVQTDTYTRELERYGSNTMELSEALFTADSITTINLISLVEGDDGERIKWQFALLGMDELLNNFGYFLENKFKLFEELKDQFINEHGGNKALHVQLDTKFRNFRSLIDETFSIPDSPSEDIAAIKNLLKWRTEKLLPIAQEIIGLQKQDLLNVSLDDLIKSYLHMTLNRIFKSRQRTYEMVLYTLLYKYYKALIAKERSKNIII